MPVMDHEAYDYEWLERQNQAGKNLGNQILASQDQAQQSQALGKEKEVPRAG
jgi:hypothetical protein